MSQAAGYSIEDPRPVARDAPYTYFLPSDDELAAIAPGDLVKLNFRAEEPGEKWDAERMWVVVDKIEGDRIEGRLDNEPDDMPCLSWGMEVHFLRHHVIDIVWADDRETCPPAGEQVREFWERCLVDSGVLTGDLWIYYIYRENADQAGPDDKYPDSGWRIRGWRDGLTVGDDDLEELKPKCVAIGAVLNRDDTWLHLIDEPVGSEFIRQDKTEPFAPVE